MTLIKKQEMLTLAIKIPRALHDRLDEVREAAKKIDSTYDPAPRLIKALEKDLAAAQREIEAAHEAAKKSTVQ